MNRLFLAMPVTLFDYADLQSDFDGILKGRWVIPQNLHLTLNFFADRFEQAFLIETLGRLDLKAAPSELKGMGILDRTRILYARTENDPLFTLNRQISETLMLPTEQTFIPHVTLMRIKTVMDTERFEQTLKTYEEKVIGELQPRIQLIQSRLSSEGAHYTVLKEFNG